MPGKRITLPDLIRRLRAADVLLASADGLHVPTFAVAHNISIRAVSRLLRDIREIGHAHEVRHDATADRYTHHYVPDVLPIFRETPYTGKRGPKKRIDRALVRDSLAQGMSTAVVARLAGCSVDMVRKIRAG